ncbi:MAG TPA: hypothetical protein VL574_00700, partial [Stellaceae bacterium]|nr:hypothetical protein [Stellaceae bacterium]
INRQAAADKALVLAMGQLHMALAGSGPYDAPLAVAISLAGDDKALTDPLDQLQAHAHDGLPGLVILRGRLDDVAEEASVPPPVASDAPWWRRSLAPLMRLVKVSRVPENGDAQAMPPGPERSIALARAALDAGDLPGAVKAMGALSHPEAKAKAWLADAQARLDAQNALTRADGEVTKRMSGGAATDNAKAGNAGAGHAGAAGAGAP